MSTIKIYRVFVPAMSTIGYAWGKDIETGEAVKFAGDHRPMSHLCDALRAAAGNDAEPPEVEVEGWQILSREAV
jgi:hypothetical protein